MQTYDYYFQRYQQQLVWFANTPQGREFLHIKEKELINKVVPNGYHLLLDENIFQAKLYTGNFISYLILSYLIEYDLLCSLGKVVGWHDATEIFTTVLHRPVIFHSLKTIIDGTGNGTTFNDNQGTYATCRGLASGTASNNPDSNNIYASKLTSFSIARGFIPVDTSSLAVGAVVSGGYLEFTVSAIVAGTPIIHLMQGNQASSSTVAGTDYARPTGLSGVITSGGNVTAVAGTNRITMNATAQGWVNVTGFSLLGICEQGDQQNSDPGVVDNRLTVYFNSHGLYQPTLNVIYKLPNTPYTNPLRPAPFKPGKVIAFNNIFK